MSSIGAIQEQARIDEEVKEAMKGDRPITAGELRDISERAGAETGNLQSSSEMVPVYNRYDNTVSQISSDQLRQRLGVRFDQHHPAMPRELVWTTKRPEQGPSVGRLKCPLHPESDRREYLNDLGYAHTICQKSNMQTSEDVENHYKKHKSVYAAEEKDKEKTFRDRQLKLMEEQTAAMQRMAAAQAPSPEQQSHPGTTCNACDAPIEGKLADHKCR